MLPTTSTLAKRGTRLSVVIASYNSMNTIDRCLESLEQQEPRDDYEVIVVDSSVDGTGAFVARKFPCVRLFSYSERKFPGDARNIGVSHALGDIIAFTDADCFVDKTWVSRVLEAHDTMAHPVIGGAVENGNPGNYVGWAHYFTEFSAWMPQAAPCEMVEIPTTCLTLKRWVFDRYGPFRERTYSSDTAFNWTVARHGYRPFFCPSLRVFHVNITSVRAFLGRKMFHGMCFAKVRIAEQRFSRMRRWAYVAISPVLPALLLGRVCRRVLRTKRHAARFMLTVPLVLLGLIAWSCGELRGYLSPPGLPATS